MLTLRPLGASTVSTITSIPARDFARNLAGAKRAASSGPVLITDRGQPAYALLRIEDYYRLAGGGSQDVTLAQAMAVIDGGVGITFEPAPIKGMGLQVPNIELQKTKPSNTTRRDIKPRKGR
jgi:hypothetical protein